MNNERRDVKKALCFHPVQELPPRPVGPSAALQELLRREIDIGLGQKRSLAVAVHLALLAVLADGSQPPCKRMVVHENLGEGGGEGLHPHRSLVHIEVLDGEPQELLVVEVGEIEGVPGLAAAWAHQDRLLWVATVWDFYRLCHGRLRHFQGMGHTSIGVEDGIYRRRYQIYQRFQVTERDRWVTGGEKWSISVGEDEILDDR